MKTKRRQGHYCICSAVVVLALLLLPLECEAFTAPLGLLTSNQQQATCSLARETGESYCSSHDDESGTTRSTGTSIIPFSLLEHSVWEDDRRPRRWTVQSSSSSTEKSPIDESLGLPRQKFFPNNEWGIHDAATAAMGATTTAVGPPLKTRDETNPAHPSSMRSPNRNVPVFPYTLDQVANEAVKAIRQAVHDRYCPGRLSIEIDGAQHLQMGQSLSGRGGSGAGALRKLTLVMAQKLATDPTIRDQNDDFNGGEKAVTNKERSVVVYLNTIKQTMLAAYEFQDLASISGGEAPRNVTILTMGDHLPTPLQETLKSPTQIGRPRKKGRPRTSIHPSRGFVVVVQPTDYNDEHQPPGPSVTTVEALQRLSAQASLLGLTTVLISPRFLASPHYHSMMPSSWRQGDGTRQVAASFGGQEPGRQPNLWLLRDFHPPILSWIGHGVSLSPPSTAHEFDKAPLRRYTRVALLQTGAKGAWHVFGARQQSPERSTAAQVLYDYWASTNGASGRPTRQVMRQIYEEFYE